MNYAKVVQAALLLFPPKIKVKLIHEASGNQIGTYKLDPEQLPQQFNKPITLTILDKKWRVLKATPSTADDYLIFKNLTLHVLESHLVDTNIIPFPIPTTASQMPDISASSMFDDFVLDLPSEAWRQIELLPVSLLSKIKKEIAFIAPLISEANNENLLLGYHSTHSRRKIGIKANHIPFDAFCKLVNAGKKGAIHLGKLPGSYVTDGFALQSDNYIYYGTMRDNTIAHLCLRYFDCADHEILQVLGNFELALVDWCAARIFTGELKDEQEQNPTTAPTEAFPEMQ